MLPTHAPSPAEESGSGVPDGLTPHVRQQVALARVVVLTRAGCHLCEQAEAQARRVTRDHGASLALVDVDSDPHLREAFTDHVPVTFVDGCLLDYWQLDAERLALAIDGEQVAAPAPL